MKNFIFTILLLTTLIFNVSASEDTMGFLSSKDKEILYTNGEISRYFFDKDLPSYLFYNSFESKLLEEITKQEITIGVESLYLLKYSDLPEKTNIDDISIFNTLLSVKTMKGIEYYSKSRKKMRTLYTESFAVQNPDSSQAIPDPVFKDIPEELSRYLLQTDKTFGENLYEALYRYDGSTIWINIVNKTKMKYKFIPMVGADNMNVNLFVTTTSEGILFYGVSFVETSSFLGLAKSKKDSFYNRIKAMFSWFSNELVLNIKN